MTRTAHGMTMVLGRNLYSSEFCIIRLMPVMFLNRTILSMASIFCEDTVILTRAQQATIEQQTCSHFDRRLICTMRRMSDPIFSIEEGNAMHYITIRHYNHHTESLLFLIGMQSVVVFESPIASVSRYFPRINQPFTWTDIPHIIRKQQPHFALGQRRGIQYASCGNPSRCKEYTGVRLLHSGN